MKLNSYRIIADLCVMILNLILIPLYLVIYVVSLYFRYADSSKPIKAKHVLVTGATSGLGRAIAHSYSKTCGTLILVGRNENKLEEVKIECKTLNSRCNIKMVVADMTNTSAFSQKMKEVADSELVGQLKELITGRWIWLLQPPALSNPLLLIREIH